MLLFVLTSTGILPAATLAFTGVLSLAAIVAGTATALSLAGILALAIVLGGLSLLGFLWLFVLREGSACCQTCDSRAECDPKLSAIHMFSLFQIGLNGAFVN